MADIAALQEQIRNIINADRQRSVEEETADRETLKKLCWDVMVESRGAMSMGRNVDEAVFRQARMRLTALEHGGAIKDLPLMDELYSFSEAHKDTAFHNAFEEFLRKNDPDNVARSNALELMRDCCGDIKGDESKRLRGLLETAMNRKPGTDELPGQHDYIEKEKYKEDTRQTNIGKWTILRDWVRENKAIPSDMRQRMVDVLTSSIKSGQAPAEKADRDLIDRALTGSYAGDKQKFTGYYSWARENNGRELPSATYIRKPMEKGRRYLLGGPGDSAVYQRAGGDIFIENKDGVIPREIMNTSNVDEISDFLTVYADELKGINPLYVEYLKRQTESVIKIEGMANALKNGDKPVPVPVTKKGRGSVIPIKQEEHQTSGNGCWSVAYSNLLQSQGIKLSQQEIRAYRQTKDPVAAGKLTEAEAEILFNDKVANPFEKRDILHTLLPGKAMQEVVFSFTEEGDRKTQLKRTEDFLKKHIKEALDVNHSPVALLVGGHYQTIVGYNGDTLLYKDSLPHEELFGRLTPPNTTYDDLSFRSLAERVIDSSEPVVLDSLIDVEKLPDVKASVADEASNPGSYAFLNIDSGVPGISIKMSHSKQVHSNLMKNVPEEMLHVNEPVAEPAHQQAEAEPEPVAGEPEVQAENTKSRTGESSPAAQAPQDKPMQQQSRPASVQKEPEQPKDKSEKSPVRPEVPKNVPEEAKAEPSKPQDKSEEKPAARGANARLEDAIDDVEAVYGRMDGITEDFRRIGRMATELQRITAPYFEKGKVLTDKDISTILYHYDNLLRACDHYLKSISSTPDKGYDLGRSHCVRALRGIVVEDMRSLNESMGVTMNERTLLGVVQKGRTIQADVDRPDDIKTVGGAMSTRIPVRLKCEDGSIEEGFFTESRVLEDYTKRMQRLKKETLEKYGENSAEYSIAKAVCIEDARTMRHTYSPRVDQIMALSDKNVVDDVAESPEAVKDVMAPFFVRLDKDTQDRLMDRSKPDESKALRKFFMNLTHEAVDYAAVFYTQNSYAGIPAGERMDKRNTAMSTVADYLGMGSLIAGSRSFEIQIGEDKKQGTFQQKAGGTDINRITKDNEIVEIAENYKSDDYGAVDTPSFKRQLSDLMVLDYLCGNCDRHMANMLYQTGKDRSGRVVITGIKGIDNDMSFGKKTEASNISQEKMVNPEDMRIMRLTTAHRILDLTPDKLDLMLGDMDFTKDEKEACHVRLKKLQDKLRSDMKIQTETNNNRIADGKIVVVPDDRFKYYPIEELGETGKGKESSNYFGNAKLLPRLLYRDLVKHRKFAKQEDEIRYVDATATSGSLNFVDRDVRTDLDYDSTMSRLESLGQSFDKLGSKWFTKDTGHFQWMKRSLEQYKDNLKMTYDKMNSDGITEASKNEVIKLDAFFRQVRMASDNYVKTHPNPITPSGKARKKLAMEMMEMRPVYQKSAVSDMDKAQAKDREVKPTDIGRLMKDEKRANKKSADKKEKSAAKKNRPVRSRSVNPDNRKNMSM